MSYLFKDKPRTDASPCRNTESFYDHLDRSAHLPMERVRNFIETMLDSYPEEDRSALVGRLRSQNNDAAQSALFELIIHHMLIITGHTILALEPEIPGSKKRPDFLVQTPEGNSLYLECLRLAETPDAEAGGRSIQDEFRDAMNAVACPYHLELTVDGLPTKQPSSKRFKTALTGWIENIEADDPAATEPFSWSAHGMTFSVDLFRPVLTKRDPASRSAGVEFFGAGFVPVDGNISASLKVKMKKYGELDHPLVVAVTTPNLFAGTEELITALFGTQTVSIDPNNSQAEPKYFRNNDGLWRGDPWQYARCSAVLFFKSLSVSSLDRSIGTLVHHPAPSHPASLSSLPVTELVYSKEDGGKLVIAREGQPLSIPFVLPDGWPESLSIASQQN